jgi:hypothetical protein
MYAPTPKLCDQHYPDVVLCDVRSRRYLNPSDALAPLFVGAKSASNDEAERRGDALPRNVADLFQSSTPPWLIEDASSRDRSSRLLDAAR